MISIHHSPTAIPRCQSASDESVSAAGGAGFGAALVSSTRSTAAVQSADAIRSATLDEVTT